MKTLFMLHRVYDFSLDDTVVLQDITASVAELKRVEERRARTADAERPTKESIPRIVSFLCLAATLLLPIPLPSL